MTAANPKAPCPCGSGRALERCCGRWHAGEPAPDAETLMRSRYSAYVLGLDRYLLDTWHPSTRPASLDDPERPATRWLGLEVRRALAPVADASGEVQAWVEFVARHRVAGRGYRLHELSRFVREDGRWFYIDGEIRSSAGEK